MAQAPATTVRIDPQLKAEANAIFDELGISLSAGVSAFLKAVVRTHGMPFEMRLGDEVDKMGTSSITHATSLPSVGRNHDLNRAGLAKKDEFYTQLEDIEAELCNYKEQFKNQVVLCNCDDPFESNFFRFFVQHFNDYGIKKLIATCYGESSYAGRSLPVCDVLTTCRARHNCAYQAVVTHVDTNAPLDTLTPESLRDLFSLPGNSIELLRGNGDFRSEECLALLEGCDIVVTNPPFSLFREFLHVLIATDKKFLIIGNVNAATYKEVFPLIRDNRLWLGASIHSGDRKFSVPDDYPLDAASCGVDEEGRRYIRVKGVRWFTNLDMGQRHRGISLEKTYSPEVYPTYENYNAINVSRCTNIPKDYAGIMGVPITFLDKYDPDQFEILMLANGNVRANADQRLLSQVGYRRHKNDRGGVGVINGKRTYARILIRNKKPVSSDV